MRIKAKMIMLALATGSLALQFWGGNCGRFWGDIAGDLLILQGVD
jgi:hypothetical protein